MPYWSPCNSQHEASFWSAFWQSTAPIFEDAIRQQMPKRSFSLADVDPIALGALWPSPLDFESDIQWASTTLVIKHPFTGVPVTVFDEYVIALAHLKEVEEAKVRNQMWTHSGCIVMGSTGIGKSFSLSYFLAHRLWEKKHTVFYMEGTALLFCQSGVFENSGEYNGMRFFSNQDVPAGDPLYIDVDTWVLMDADQTKHPPPTLYTNPKREWFPVFAASPDRARLKWQEGHNPSVFLMQPPQWRELVATAQFFGHSYSPLKIIEILRNAFDEFGPKTRQIFYSLAERSYVTLAYRNLISKTIDFLARNPSTFTAVINATAEPTALMRTDSHCIFTLMRPSDGDGRLTVDVDMCFASARIFDQLLTACAEKRKMTRAGALLDLFSLFVGTAAGPTAGPMIGTVWQAIDIRVLTGDFGSIPGLKMCPAKRHIFPSCSKKAGAGGKGTPKVPFTRFFEDTSVVEQSDDTSDGLSSDTSSLTPPSAKQARIEEVTFSSFASVPTDSFCPLFNAYTRVVEDHVSTPYFFQTTTSHNHPIAVVEGLKVIASIFPLVNDALSPKGRFVLVGPKGKGIGVIVHPNEIQCFDQSFDVYTLTIDVQALNGRVA